MITLPSLPPVLKPHTQDGARPAGALDRRARADQTIRRDLVQQVKAQIFLGRYTTERKIDLAIERLIDDIHLNEQ